MKKLVILTFFAIMMFSLILGSTYGIFESNLEQSSNIDVAAWEITVNDLSVTNEVNTFDIGDIIWEGSENVKSGKVAPGMKGYFDIVINPNKTDVSFRYDIIYDIDYLSNINKAFKVTKIEELNGNPLILTDKYSYTNIIDIDEIKKGTTHTIRTHVKWEDISDNGDNDYLSGTSDISFEIPITVNIVQYLGEEIKEYVGEEIIWNL